MTIKFDRILWLQPNEHETYSSEIRGLEMLGAVVLPLNYREEVLRLGIARAREHILKTIEEFGPNLMLIAFFANSYELSPEFLREVSSKAPLVIRPGDDEVFGTWQTIYFAQSVDAIIVCDFVGQILYEQLLIPTVYFRSPTLDFVDLLPSTEKSIDVSYLGDCNKADRADYIGHLRENGIEVATYGNNSENGFISRGDFLKIISISKINLNFTKRDVPAEILKKEPWRLHFRHLSGRAFEAARLKSFCLSEYCMGLNEMLEIGSEVDAFYNKKELLEKVKFYLTNDVKREEMATKAFERVKNNYGDLDGLSSAFNSLHEKLRSSKGEAKNRPIFRSFEFDASEVKGNFFIFIKLLMRGRFVQALGAIPYFLNLRLSCLVGLWRAVTELISRSLRNS